MALDRDRIVSSHSPYVPISVIFAGEARVLEFEALIDTGFDGELILPVTSIPSSALRRGDSTWRLAEGSQIRVRDYLGELRIGQMHVAPVAITALGNAPIIGRGVTRHFTVTFDHDRQVIIEP